MCNLVDETVAVSVNYFNSSLSISFIFYSFLKSLERIIGSDIVYPRNTGIIGVLSLLKDIVGLKN